MNFIGTAMKGCSCMTSPSDQRASLEGFDSISD